MKPAVRFQNQLFFRKNYQQVRTIRIKPEKSGVLFRPARRRK